jgi:hydrogenase maturation protease
VNVLVAGVGNLFFGDDGFGVEVVRHMTDPASAELPTGVRAADFGIRAVHLAYELLAPLDLLVVIDCMSRGEPPGTLYVVEPDPVSTATPVGDAHTMDLDVVFATLHELGGTRPPTLIVGCEPVTIAPGMGLSPSVSQSIPAAVELVHELIQRRKETV